MSTKRIAPLSLRIDPQVKAALEALAASQDRSLSNYVQRLLREHIKASKTKSNTDKRS